MPSFPLASRSSHQAPDRHFPVVAARGSSSPVILDAEDGAVRRIAVRSLTIQAQRDGHIRDTAGLRRGAGELLVTDSRVVMAVSRPTPDTLLAGHVLLDWIVAVGGCTEASRFRDDALRMVIELENSEYVVITLTFDDGVDVHELAQDIARRTARSWLAQQGSSPLVGRWTALAQAPRLSAENGEFALHFPPSYARIAPPAARFERAGVPA